MRVDAIPALAAETTASSPVQQQRFEDFAQWLESEIQGLDTQLGEAETSLRQLAVGETRNIHEVMMALEKARLSFELVVQVRNRALESYQEIMRMQV